MSTIVLRLSAPLQSWSGYRHQLNMSFSVPTATIPRKSAVSGLIGAALGRVDRGFGSASNLLEIGNRFEMSVRVETLNPPVADFQVLSPVPSLHHPVAERAEKIGSATTKAFPTKRGGGNFPTTVSVKDYLPHSEFIAALHIESDATISAWTQALVEPVFMTYLGRKSCSPTFPFFLGIFDGTPNELFSAIPSVSRGRDRTQESFVLQSYEVSGDYDGHAQSLPTTHRVRATSRQDQLEWCTHNLRRDIP